jgi:prevent-host-death family protein
MTTCSHKKEVAMQTMQLREAKASLSAVVASAERGLPTLITRHGHPSAMVVPIEDGKRLYPLDAPSLAAHLLAMPEHILFDRDPSPLQSVDL